MKIGTWKKVASVALEENSERPPCANAFGTKSKLRLSSGAPGTGSIRGCLALLAMMVMCADGALAATVTVTKATGGSSISADTAGATWTTLSGPTIAESAAGTIGTGTIILHAPSGFAFNTANPVTATVSKVSGPNGTRLTLSSSSATLTSSTITITVASKSSSEIDQITWSGIQVRPTAGTPLASGNITETGTSTFTYAAGSSASNYGTLTEVAGATSQLTVTQQPSAAATAGTVFAQQPTVTAQDQFGNPASGTTVTATETTGGNLNAATTAQTATFSAGVANFSGLFLTNASSSVTLTFTSSALSTTSTPINVSPASASRLAVATQPSGAATAGTPFATQPAVTVLDAYGNTAAADGTTITAAETSGGNLDATTIAQTALVSGGVASFGGLYVTNAGTVTLTFTSSGLSSATSSAINVSPLGANSFSIETASNGSGTIVPTQNIASGSSITVYPIMRDLYGNFVSNPSSTWSLTGITGGVAGSDLTPAAGASATFTGQLLGSAQINAVNGAFSANSGTLTVVPGAASKLAITTQPSLTATAGQVFAVQPVVTVQDTNGNTVASYATAITARETSGGNLNATTTAQTAAPSSGIATFSGLYVTNSGNVTLTFTSGTLTSAVSSTIAVSPASASKVAFGVQPSTTTAGSAINPAVTVKVLDQFGNTVTNDTSSVTIGSATTAFTGSTLTVAAVNGVATFGAVQPTTAGAANTLTASDGALTGATSSTFTVNASVANKLAFGVQPSTTTAGSAINPAVTVKVQDQFGNTVTTNTSSVTISSSTTAFTGSTLTVAAVSGVATFSAVKPTTAGAANTLTASDASLTGATSAVFIVNISAASKLAFGVQPSTTTAGSAISPAVTVIVQDSFGNTVTNNTSSVTIASGTTAFTGSTLTVAAVGGVATFSAVKPTTAGAANTLTASDSSLTSATSAPFTVNPSVASKLAFGVQPSTTTAGSAINPAATVKVQDQFGNTVTSDTSSVTIGSGNTAFAGSTLAVSAVSGVATFSAVKPITAGPGKTLTGTDGALTGATSATFTVNGAVTSSSVTSSAPSSVFGQSVTFTATVTSTNGLTPTGTVTFKDGGTTLGTGALNGSAQATFSTNSLAVGSRSITVVYGGDSTFAGSTSPVMTQTVSKANTSVALVSSLNPACAGQSVGFTATVTAVAPGAGTATGSVTFKDGTTSLATITLSSGVATLNTSTLSSGPRSITAVYNGSTSFNTNTSAVLTETINPLPTATVTGTGTICLGNSTNIQAALTGTAPWTVTWSDGLTQNNLLTSPAVRPVSPGSTTTYTVTSVSDSHCSNTGSGSATVTVDIPPSITSQPVSSMTLCAGNPAVFSVTATGSVLTYQWLKNGTNLANGGNISGATTATLTINPSTTGNSGSYSVRVSGFCAPSVTSSTASLTVSPTPNATISAAGDVCSSTPNNVASVADAGPGASYAWSITGGTITSGTGTRSITYTAGASGTISLRANVTNSVGCSASGTSSVVIPVPSRTIEAWKNSAPLQWQSSTFNKGDAYYSDGTTIPMRFVLTNMCPGGSWTINILYDFKDANTASHFYDFVTTYNTSEQTELGSECAGHVCGGIPTTFPIPADTNLSYEIPGVFTVYNGTITNVSPVITTNKSGSTIQKQYTLSGVTAPGSTAQDVLILLGAHLAGEIQWGAGNGPSDWSGASGKIYVQFSGESSLADLAINPATVTQLGDLAVNTMSATPGPVCAGSTISYSMTITNAGPDQAQSVTVQDNLPAGLTPVSAVMSQGTVTGTTNLTFSLGNINAASNATISMVVSVSPSAAAGTYVNTATISAVAPTDPNNNNNTLSASTLIYARTTASPLSNQLGCLGIPTTFSTVVSGTGPFTYLWSKNGTTINGATAASFTIPSVSSGDAGNYCVVVTGTCNSVTNCASLTVSTNASTSPLTSLTKCPGETAVFSTTPSGTGPFTIDWKKNGVIIPGQTGTTLTLPNVSAADAATYCVEVAGFCNATNNCATLTVNSPVQVVIAPASQNACAGSNATFSVSATGTSLTYQWYAGTNLLTGQTASSLTITNVTGTNLTSYSVVVSGACGNPVTNTASLTVILPVVNAPADVAVACTNSLDPNVTPALGVATVTDTCSTTTPTYSDQIIPGRCAGSYTIKRTWSSQDGFGNVSTAVQTITVQDTAPVVIAPPDLVLAYTADTSTNSTGVATVQAVCGPVSLGYSDVVTALPDGSEVIARPWVGTDNCGNSGSALQTITLSAPLQPILPSQGDVAGTVLVTITVTNTATDPNGTTNTLSYQMLNPPAGVTIDSNGVITWTPTLGQSPSTNIITTVVTITVTNSTGSSTISTTNSFVVTVTGPYDGLDMLVDSDGDGLTNLVEVAVGGDPLNPTDGNNDIIIYLTQAGTNHYIAMKYKARINAAALQLQYLPEVSADKVTWYSDPSHVLGLGVTPADSVFNWVTVRDTTPITPEEARFIRLHVIWASMESFSPIWIGSDTLLKGNNLTLFSQRMVRPILSAGTISSVSSAVLNDTNASFTSGAFGTNGTPAYVECNNGAELDIANALAQTVTLTASATGLASAGDAYRLRAHFTVASLLGTNNETALVAGPNPAQADNVLIFMPETQTILTVFYFSNPSFTTFQGWVRADTFTPCPDLVVYPEEGMMVRRIVPSDAHMYLCGPIKLGVTLAPVQPGYNLFGTLKSLTSMPLSTLNLHTGTNGIAGGLNPSQADNLIVVQPDGSVATYFFFDNPGTFQGWINANGFTFADSVLIPPGSAFFIYRQAPGAFTWTIPAE